VGVVALRQPRPRSADGPSPALALLNAALLVAARRVPPLLTSQRCKKVRRAHTPIGLAVAFFLVSASVHPIYPCGPSFPNWLLVDPDREALSAPQAMFDRELERMQLVKTARRARPSKDYAKDTLAVELADLRLALDLAGVVPDARDRIVQGHRAEREKISLFAPPEKVAEPPKLWPGPYVLRPNPTNNTRITQTDLPRVTAGLLEEFADYFRGSVAWHQGDIAGARRPWLRLLDRSSAERHFKSTWAAFMLGKSWEEEDRTKAISYFRKVRELADAGFADSLGLSVASLGWEARLLWRENRFVEATGLYLEQAAAGDTSALLSLRFVASDALDAGEGVLEAMARHPRAQRVVTAYVIAGGYSRPAIDVDGLTKEQTLRAWEKASAKLSSIPAPKPAWHHYRRPVLLWLEAVEKANVRDIESAESLALAAYQAGEMENARRWLQRARSTPVTQWLQAKLLLRDGKTDEAAALLASICRRFPADAPTTNAPAGGRLADNLYRQAGEFYTASMAEQTRAELGLSRLARRQFVEALDALLHSSDAYWMDAAYVAERVLTLEELRDYVDRHWPPPLDVLGPVPASKEAEASLYEKANTATVQYQAGDRIRYLLARRLVRADRLAEAHRFFPPDWLPLYEKLLADRREAERVRKPQEERARALFEAAGITRRYGLELLGTEVEPDWRIHAGNFEEGVSVAIRSTMTTNLLPVTQEEIQRANRHGVEPDRRWHYRHTAAVLAWEAGKLLLDADTSNQPAAERAKVLMEMGRYAVTRDVSFVRDPGKVGPEVAPVQGWQRLWREGYTAAALAWEAARLLPDDSDETARILCEGGSWIKARDPQAADILYKALVRRCRKTAIGAQADRLRWFPRLDDAGHLMAH
jgi:tetratricopeptide (TPR) repeat protein